MPKASLSTCHVEFTHPCGCVTISTGGTEMFSFRVTSSRGRGVYFVTITLIYIIIIINLHTWNKISIMHFECRYTLHMFLHILEKSTCFDSCGNVSLMTYLAVANDFVYPYN